MKWQERYARWIMQPKWPRPFNAKLEPYLMHWWIYVGFGVLIAATIVVPLLPIENPMESNDYENIDQQRAALAFYGLKIAACLFAWFSFLGSVLIGSIIEERKGYRMIIEKLEAEGRKREQKEKRSDATFDKLRSGNIKIQ